MMVAAFIASLKVTTTLLFVAIDTAFAAGTTDVIEGLILSGLTAGAPVPVVVNVQEKLIVVCLVILFTPSSSSSSSPSS